MSDDRRFHAGQTFEMDGITFRVQQGRKAIRGNGDGQDLRLDWFTPGGEWRAVTFGPVFLMADFFFENEQVLYPYPNEGSGYFWKRLREAMKFGHRDAIDRLQAEKRARRERERVG